MRDRDTELLLIGLIFSGLAILQFARGYVGSAMICSVAGVVFSLLSGLFPPGPPYGEMSVHYEFDQEDE